MRFLRGFSKVGFVENYGLRDIHICQELILLYTINQKYSSVRIVIEHFGLSILHTFA